MIVNVVTAWGMRSAWTPSGEKMYVGISQLSLGEMYLWYSAGLETEIYVPIISDVTIICNNLCTPRPPAGTVACIILLGTR